MESRVVTVEINGMRFPIRSHLDAAYIADLAAYVEQKMQIAARESPAGDTLKIAVLAALNIADECFRARDEGTAHLQDVSQRTRELEAMLDLALAAEPLARAAGSH
jgi:cell division protein ZapA